MAGHTSFVFAFFVLSALSPVILGADVMHEDAKRFAAKVNGNSTIPFLNDPRNVIVNKIAICPEGRPAIEIDLAGYSLYAEIKKTKVVLTKGVTYHVKVYFYVQREIVAGLLYVQKVYRKGIQVDKSKKMMGSYGPKSELQMYRALDEEAPSGMLARGDYAVKSSVRDDDKNIHLKSNWFHTIKEGFE